MHSDLVSLPFCDKPDLPNFLDGHPVLASATEAGHISLWDLSEKGRLLHTVRGAHDGGVTALEWVAGQPLLISSGDDNSVKVSDFFVDPQLF